MHKMIPSFRRLWKRRTGATQPERTPRTTMDLPFDVVDHIFSFLKSHPKALLACSNAHPILSQIVERYRFRHIIIHTGLTCPITYSFTPSDLLIHLRETPWIVKYVTVLQIEFDESRTQDDRMTRFEAIASLLPMFTLLECIVLSSGDATWRKFEYLPQSLITAVERCLDLPTLQEVHVGALRFPLSILGNHANINHLSLSGPPERETEDVETTHPQIKSLALHGSTYDFSITWAKRHIAELQSLKYEFSCNHIIVQVLRICANTLENLHVHVHRKAGRGSVQDINISSLPRLRHLTIQAEIYSEYSKSKDCLLCHTYLREALEILKTASSLQQLTIEIDVNLSRRDIDRIDLSPLRILTQSSARFHHIDLYVYSALPWDGFTFTKLGSLLEQQEGLMELIERGVLVVHPEAPAPTFSSRSCIAREEKPPCIIM